MKANGSSASARQGGATRGPMLRPTVDREWA